MTITIHDHSDTHRYYDVTFFDKTINTLVTDTPSSVDRWISKIKHIHRYCLDNLVVGLDVEWRPNTNRYVQNPVAILQLCVGRNCLIYQIMDLAVEEFGAKELRNTGLKGLTGWVLGKELDKPKHVTMSRWDEEWLTLDQVQYACVDAYLSFEIGRSLIYGD
ncbi:ribonuclease H-like domain-containing protein [Artemisia annua]|uniref:Ribonuclease H-like domain-containing protein n=1 Tax=Artemisia annua TaxID=35608 RepID=A0A2U1PD27_ARTAN|nr:ribonuclease H-like domain-containing protein [Artemisia annua]